MDTYDLALTAAGIAALGAALLPRLLAGRPLSLPIVYVVAGALLFALPVGLPFPDPTRFGVIAERVTELGVVIALMGAGLKIDRPLSRRAWGSTWRLLGVTMPLAIAATAFLGSGLLGLGAAGALLLGAVLAPTDPVLASDVQVGEPRQVDHGAEPEDEVRFALTSEAGFNDGFAFPFTNAAVAMASVGVAPSLWLRDWLVADVVVKIVVGLVVGVAVGRLLGRVAFRGRALSRLAEHGEGFVAIAATLLSYGVAEIAHGYGFLAVFVAALALRAYEHSHSYHEVLHSFAEQSERLLTAGLLVLVGGAVAGGLLAPLDWRGVAVGAAVVLVVRPLAGWVALSPKLGGLTLSAGERGAIAFFGIRGIGSFYYLAYAFNHAMFEFGEMELLWAVTTFTVLLSVVVHGIAAKPVMRRLDARRAATSTLAPT